MAVDSEASAAPAAVAEGRASPKLIVPDRPVLAADTAGPDEPGKTQPFSTAMLFIKKKVIIIRQTLRGALQHKLNKQIGQIYVWLHNPISVTFSRCVDECWTYAIYTGIRVRLNTIQSFLMISVSGMPLTKA